MQPAYLCPAHIGPCRIVGVCQHDHAGAFRHPFQNRIYISRKALILRGNRNRIIRVGIVRDLGVSVYRVDQFVAWRQVRAGETCKQII